MALCCIDSTKVDHSVSFEAIRRTTARRFEAMLDLDGRETELERASRYRLTAIHAYFRRAAAERRLDLDVDGISMREDS